MELELEEVQPRAGRGQTIVAPLKGDAPTTTADPRFRDAGTRNTILDTYKAELAQYRDAMTRYHESDIDVILATISAHHARVAQIRSDLQYMAGADANQFRTKQVDPFLDELVFQFKVNSRRLSNLEAEAKLTGGYT